ncbi:MAG: carbon-nitrogen hydrolase family protein [Planctomycetota bacterium]
MTTPVRVAACQYPIERLKRWSDFRAKLTALVEAAARGGARLAVFPEYASLELAALFDASIVGDLRAQLAALETLHDDYVALSAELSGRFGVDLLAASLPTRVGGEYRNRAYFFRNGVASQQEKIQMTRFEREEWGITGGDRLRVFRADYGLVAIAICYDAEFPELVRRQTDAGATIVLVPSCTDTAHGAARVEIAARARALENQCYVVCAPTWGDAPWSPALDVNTGRAGIYTPVDRGFPANGILAQGDARAPGWTFADLSLPALTEVRASGQVLNYRDAARTWPAVESG